MHSVPHLPRLSFLLAAVALVAVACATTRSGGAAGSPQVVAVSAAASFPTGPVPGNSVVAPLPTDAPDPVRQLAALPSCGAEILFEEDVDISPIPTAPGPTTDSVVNKQGTDCLMAAWENGLKAEFDVASISDEADEIYSMYRLVGDGTVQVIVRVRSHADKTTAWTQTTCRQLSVQEGSVTPADCDLETPIP